MNPTIQTHALTKTFGHTDALSGVDLTVPEGAIYALVGANGAGKTTIIKLLMNILRPTSGTAHVLGLDSHHIDGKAFNRIGYVSENQETARLDDRPGACSNTCAPSTPPGTAPSNNSSSASSTSRSSASSNTSPAA